MLNKALDKIKKIMGIEHFDNTEISVDTDDKLPDNITLKNDVILMTWVIKGNNKFYPQIFLEEAILKA